MADFRQTLIRLNENLNILREREAKYAGNAPVELLNQLADHRQAITLTEQAIEGNLTEVEWREATKPLLAFSGGQVVHIEAETYVAGDQHIHQTEIESPAWRAWTVFLGIVTIIGVIIALITVPQFNALVFPEPTITPTPLPVLPAAEGESLILIATFHETGANKTEPHVKIKRAIEDAAKEVGLDTLRVEIEPTSLTADQREEAKALGTLYDAEMVIWGEDTGIQVLVNFYNLKQPNFDAARVNIKEEYRTQLTNPSAYVEFVLYDLPGRLIFLAFLTVGQTYYGNGQYNQAIDVIEAGITALNEETKSEWLLALAHSELGLLYYNLGELQQANVQYTASIELSPSLLAYNNRGTTYADLQQYEKALEDYNHAIALNPEYAPAYNNRGGTYAALQQYEQALVDYASAIALTPEDAMVFYNRGNTYTAIHQYEQALDDFNRAIDLNPENATAYNNRGGIYFNLQQYEQAVVDSTRAIELDPEGASAFYNRGTTYYTLQLYDQALTDFDRAISLNPEYTDAYNNRGNTYKALQQYEYALADFSRVIDLNPKDFSAYNDRGGMYKALQQYDQALDDFNRAIDLNPGYASAYFNRGLIYFAQDKFELAIESVKAGLQYDTDPATRQLVEEMLADLKAQLTPQPETP